MCSYDAMCRRSSIRQTPGFGCQSILAHPSPSIKSGQYHSIDCFSNPGVSSDDYRKDRIKVKIARGREGDFHKGSGGYDGYQLNKWNTGGTHSQLPSKYIQIRMIDVKQGGVRTSYLLSQP